MPIRTGNDVVDAASKLHRLIESSGLESWKKAEWLELLERASMYDPLTTLVNRTFLDARFGEEIARVERHNHPLSAIMVDVDDFKLYNNTYGHQQGDEGLRYIAEILKSNRRPADIVARYGGEEFLLVLPETDLVGAERVADDITRRFISTPLGVYKGDESRRGEKYSGSKGFQTLTVSMGIASYPSITEDPRLLISHADKALYITKNSGKSGFRVHGK